jgi:predicted esterase
MRIASFTLVLLMLAASLYGQEMSLREMAWAAMAAKDFAKARPLLEKWLEADPGDAPAWYNLASAHAMTKNKTKAIDAFEQAVRNLFMDVELVKRDPNLESVRSDSRFQTAFERMEFNHRESVPDGFLARLAPMRSLGTYVVMLPPDYEKSNKTYPLVLILHGSGSNEIEHGRIVDNFGRDGVIYAAVRAPFPALSVVADLKKPAFTAWPAEAGRSFEPARDIYIDWIFDVAEYVREEFRVRQGKIYLWGHSQGGQFAKMSALLHPDLIASYFSQAGSNVSSDFATDERLAAMKRSGVEVWIAHGKDDRSVPASTSSAWAARLQAAGITAKVFIEDGDHSINPRMRAIARQWVNDVVKKAP